jgi:hypothetical protein
MNHATPYVHVWENGRVSHLSVTDNRSWPFVVAVILRHAARMPRGGWKVLNQAEWMATHRATFIPPWTSHTAILSEIIDGCDLCGKKALYMSGWSGRCLEHRGITDAHVVARMKRKRAASDEIEQQRDRIDQVLRLQHKIHGTANRGLTCLKSTSRN